MVRRGHPHPGGQRSDLVRLPSRVRCADREPCRSSSRRPTPTEIPPSRPSRSTSGRRYARRPGVHSRKPGEMGGADMKPFSLTVTVALAITALAAGIAGAGDTKGPPCANMTAADETSYYSPTSSPQLQWIVDPRRAGLRLGDVHVGHLQLRRHRFARRGPRAHGHRRGHCRRSPTTSRVGLRRRTASASQERRCTRVASPTPRRTSASASPSRRAPPAGAAGGDSRRPKRESDFGPARGWSRARSSSPCFSHAEAAISRVFPACSVAPISR